MPDKPDACKRSRSAMQHRSVFKCGPGHPQARVQAQQLQRRAVHVYYGLRVARAPLERLPHDVGAGRQRRALLPGGRGVRRAQRQQQRRQQRQAALLMGEWLLGGRKACGCYTALWTAGGAASYYAWLEDGAVN